MKSTYEIFRREAAEQAAKYRNLEAAAECQEAKSTWASLAILMEEQAFIWECAAL